MQKVKFLYNPLSGRGQTEEHLYQIIELYKSYGYGIVPCPLTFDAGTESIASGLEGFDHLLVAGGDGTINYTVNHLRACGADIPIAILPTGTANDFAKLLGMPTNIENAVRAILEGERRKVDLGCVNGTYFVNVCSCGLFTNVSQQTPTVAKNIFGRLSYIVGGAVDLTHLHKMQLDITSDGGDFSGEALILLVFNGKSAGNFKLAYRSEVDDGLLDVLIVKGDSAIETIHTFFLYLSGIGTITRKDYTREIVHIKCRHLHAECDRKEPTDIDGEAGPDFPLDIECLTGGLCVICPVKK